MPREKHATELVRLRSRHVERLRVIAAARQQSIAAVFEGLHERALDKAYKAVIDAANSTVTKAKE